MSHPFGTLLAQIRNRKPGLSQAKLARLIGYDPAVIARLVQGHRDLLGPTSRDKVLRVIDGLRQSGALHSLDDANALLMAAGMPPLFAGSREDAVLLKKLSASLVDTFASLPTPLTGLLGRETELAELAELLRHNRLITLIGPPGVGKTRLAIEVCKLASSVFSNGIVFINLAAVESASQVAGAIAHALRVPDSINRSPLDGIRALLRERHLLLILDNFEHVVDAAPTVADLLLAAPRVKASLTSRELLRVRGERAYPTEPLALPEEGTITSPTEALRFSAISLFVERARATRPAFELTRRNTGQIIELCRSLDGLPLAIELAATRVETLTDAGNSAAHIMSGANRLAPRDLPRRQRSLDAEISWSYELLDVHEKHAFRLLSVFRGSCTTSMYSRVTNLGPLAADLLSALVQKSLVRSHYLPSGETAFSMLETIRTFARQMHDQYDNDNDAEQRHAHAHLEYAESCARLLCGSDAQAHLDAIDRDRANVRAALNWFQTRVESEKLLRFAVALARYWFLRAHYAEGRSWLTAALAQRTDTLALRAEASTWSGRMSRRLGDYSESGALLDQGVELAELAGDPTRIASAYAERGIYFMGRGDNTRARSDADTGLAFARQAGVDDMVRVEAGAALAQVATVQGDYETARTEAQRSLSIAKALGEMSFQAYLPYALGWIEMRQGRYSAAEPFFLETLEKSRLLNERKFLAAVHGILGQLYRYLQRHADAFSHLEQSIALYREMGEASEINWPICTIAFVEIDVSRIVDGERHLIQSLQLRRVHGYYRGLPNAFVGLARVRLAQDRYADAAFWLGAASAEQCRSGQHYDLAEQTECDLAIAHAKASLGAEVFDTAWTEGSTIEVDRAIAHAIDMVR